MSRKLYILPGACLLAVSVWLWVQKIAIPRQQAESVERGIPRGNLSDLYPRWLGARELLLRGRDPYGSDITREIQAGYYGRPIDPGRPNDPKDQQAFAYPVYVVFVVAPTVRLPFPLVQRTFLWLLVALTACSIPLWLRVLGWRHSLFSQVVWIVLALGSFPAIQGFKLQQLTLLVAGLVAAGISALAGGLLLLAGALLALASIKPQLVMLPMVTLTIWTLGNWRERKRLVWGFASTMLLLIVGAEILLPGWIAEFRRASVEYWQYTGGGRSVLDVELTPLWGRLASAALVGILIYWAWKLRRFTARSPEFHWLLALIMATTLAVIPMFAPYNQVLLVPALMVIVGAARTIWNAGRLSRFLLALTGFSVLWPWLSSVGLVTALLFLPASVVQRAWVLPLLTNFAIPTVTLGLLLASGRVIRSEATPASQPWTLAGKVLPTLRDGARAE